MKFGDAKSVVEIIGLMRTAVRAEFDLAVPMGAYGRGPCAVSLRLPFDLVVLLPGLDDTITERLRRTAHEEAELRLQDRMIELGNELATFGVEFGQAELDTLRQEMRAERLKEAGPPAKAVA